ncbi:ABC transporter permease [Symmachiella dynata]|uniref:ABC transporter permease n=1 Tax=Symmachiella dynata TaxID=2527995 RepID=UPI0030EB23E5
MKRPAFVMGFPLLVKELTELAARRRTYIIRVAYAVLLFVGAILMFSDIVFSRYRTPLALLGQGENMFLMIVALQFGGIYLFLPAMACSAITAEKERDSFALLLLTRLGPWTILFEKLTGRLVPMFTFMLLALPLMAFAYTYGGVQSEQIWGAIWLLGLTAVQLAALCLMFSAYCRTTVGAYLATNLFYFIFLFAIPGLAADLARLPEHKLMYFVGPAMYFEIFDWGGGLNPWGELALRSVPLVFSTLMFLGLARYYLVRRAFAQPRHLVRKIFKGLDGIFETINKNPITKGVVLVKEQTRLPTDNPVAWRETMKKNLSQFRYVLRICLLFEIPIVVVALLMLDASMHPSRAYTPLSFLLIMLWTLTALILTVQAANLIASERSRQTLDVLLTTPLSGREIVLQKMQGMRRLVIGLSVCFLTIFVCEAWMRRGLDMASYGGVGNALSYYSTWRYLVASLLSIAIYIPLIGWLALWIGLIAKTQTRAILGSLAVLFLWCAVPWGILLSLSDLFTDRKDVLTGLFSPVTMILCNEFNAFGPDGGLFPGIVRGHLFRWVVVLLNFAFYGLILYLIRSRCLRLADRYMGRREEQPAGIQTSTPPPPSPADLQVATTN